MYFYYKKIPILYGSGLDNYKQNSLNKIINYINDNQLKSELNISKFYDFFKKYIDLPFSKKELEDKVLEYKPIINLTVNDIQFIKNKYYPKLNTFKKEVNNIKKKNLHQLEDKLIELEKIINNLSHDLQMKFLGDASTEIVSPTLFKNKMYGGSLIIFNERPRKCPICLIEVNPGEGFIVRHSNGNIHPDPFHLNCLERSIDLNQTCPLCRFPMTRNDLRLPETMIEQSLRLLRNFYENIRVPIMIIMAIIISLYLVFTMEEFGIPVLNLISILLCILLLVLDIIIFIGSMMLPSRRQLVPSTVPTSLFSRFCVN